MPFKPDQNQEPQHPGDILPAPPPLHAAATGHGGFTAPLADRTHVADSPSSLEDEKSQVGDPEWKTTEAASLAPAEGAARTPGDAFMHFFGLRKSAYHNPDAVSPVPPQQCARLI